MVKIQIDISDRMSRYLGIQKEIYGLKDKRATIIKIIDEKFKSDIELVRRLNKQSKEVKTLQ